MKQKIKLMPDYYCYPIWYAAGSGEAGDVDPATLPLKPETIKQLIDWAEKYDSILNHEDPASSDFKSKAEADAFEEEGIRLWLQLREELREDYEVYYLSQRLRKHLSDPNELEMIKV
jgi:hypothetical protein